MQEKKSRYWFLLLLEGELCRAFEEVVVERFGMNVELLVEAREGGSVCFVLLCSLKGCVRAVEL
jgi:hypothetical protein